MKIKSKILIVNADDFNLTDGVNEAILECFDRGIVSSTTVMINRPLKSFWKKEIKRRPTLGLGIHLNVTSGDPVSKPSKIPSLISDQGTFKKKDEQFRRLPRMEELKVEWEAQIDLFKKQFGKLPTHLDTHHQLHDHPLFFEGIAALSKRYRLPVRRSKLLKSKKRLAFFQTSDFLWGDLDPKRYWTKSKLLTQLKKLRVGVNEIMCHPGYHDESLEKVSSFTKGREQEWKLFSSPLIRKEILKLGIVLANYQSCYT